MGVLAMAKATHALDQDLLFGLVALQNGLVEQAALVAAFRAWVAEKSEPLSEHLVRQGKLKPVQCAVIRSLVALCIEQHGGDTAKPLARSLGHCPDMRSKFEESLDADVQASLAGLRTTVVADSGSAADNDETQVHAHRVAPRFEERFQILRFHAEGGLGEVFLAYDHELNREVALKQIKGRQAHNEESRARFLREAEITGRLEHPGIVPVYGLDSPTDGQPRYAMRFIHGVTLKDAIAEFHCGTAMQNDPEGRALALRNLVGKFVSVCYTIAYAHSRGVVHRDLKPGNIMLGPYGESLVVDWGLAKAVGRTGNNAKAADDTIRPMHDVEISSPTVGPVGTLRFMSPEQAAAGEGGTVAGLASDVYSLGATLYCVLTGKPPIQGKGDGDSIRAKVRAGDFAKPRALNAQIPPALEAVCLKAMALEPQDRYASAGDLGKDIERWLADERVFAYTEPLSVRLARWTRHHRTLVSSAAVFMFAAFVALAVDLVRVGRERARAESNFLLARTAVNRILTETAEGHLAAVPQAEELRLRVASDALDFNERFLLEKPDDPEIRRDAARVFREVANIQRNLGLLTESIQAYTKAISLRAKLAAEFPTQGADRDNLALTLVDAGETYQLAGESADAERMCREALATADKVLQSNPNDTNGRVIKALASLTLAKTQLDLGAYHKAAGSAAEAATLFRAVSLDPLYGMRNAVLFCIAEQAWGAALRQQGNRAEADEKLRHVVASADSLLAHRPSLRELIPIPLDALRPSIQFARASARVELAILIADDVEQRSQALRPLDDAISELSGLSAQFPRNQSYSARLAAAFRKRGELHAALGHADKAAQDRQQADKASKASP
jgi:serine/threonine-protein kinase